jgi:hypothetical protein
VRTERGNFSPKAGDHQGCVPILEVVIMAFGLCLPTRKIYTDYSPVALQLLPFTAN